MPTTIRCVVFSLRTTIILTDSRQFGFNDDAQWWATAAYYGYRAYGDQSLLNHAISTWNHVSQL
jgi:hypothetical protein